MAAKSNGWYWFSLLALVAGLALYASERDLPGLYEDHTERTIKLQALEDDAQRLERKKVSLEHKIMGLDTDKVIQESAVRKTTGHVRDGETIYRIPLPDENN